MAEGGLKMKDVDLEGGSSMVSSDGDGDQLGAIEASSGVATAPESPAVLSPPPLGLSAAEGGGQRRTRPTEEDVESGAPTGARERPREGAMLGHPMAGVGEDEKPYNYICSLDKVNLGGPGWFNDVFQIKVDVDSDRTWMDTLSLSLVPRNAFQRHCRLLDTSEPIAGTVTVEGPAAKRVWLSGVTVTFEEHLLTVDTEGGELVGALEAQVAIGQFVSGKATFKFTLDLDLLDGHRRWPVRESYVGDLMALRHRILVSAQRPWYTFNVYSQIPVAMESLSQAPDEDAGQDNEEGGPNHLLVISDCNGRCEFDFGRDSFNLVENLSGKVTFTNICSPIVAGHVMLLKAEFMYGEASEVLVAEHTILGPKRRKPKASAVAGLTDEEQLRKQYMSPFVEQRDVHFVHSQENDCRMQEVYGNCEVDVTIPLTSLWLTPSHMSLTQDIGVVNDEAELVGVRYYIRLILEDNTQAAYWHTHEIFFHRSEPSASSTEMGEMGSNNGQEDEEEAWVSNFRNQATDGNANNDAADGYASPNRKAAEEAAEAAAEEVVVVASSSSSLPQDGRSSVGDKQAGANDDLEAEQNGNNNGEEAAAGVSGVR